MNKQRILIVDDEQDVVEFLSYNFRKAGYDVDGAYNGLEGIEKVSLFSPDLIICDVMMPRMNGTMMCDVLKSNEAMKRIPLIFLSAIQDDCGVLKAGMTGDEFVSKPVKFSFLLKIVERYLPIS